MKEIGLWIFKTFFNKEKVLPHALIRDYSRGIIEVALSRKVGLKINKNKILPNYKSKWSENIPSDKQLENKFYSKFNKKDDLMIESVNLSRP